MIDELIDSMEADPEPKRDRWGRPVIPDPDTGKETAYTRVTTFAKSISDTFGLSKWQVRTALKGLTVRPDLFALVAATPATDSKTLDRVAEDAKEAAGSSAGANRGTAFHSFSERVDRGEDVAIPPPWDTDIAAYRKALADGGLTVDRRYIERMVVIPELGCAGTFDRLLLRTGTDGPHIVGDVKTAKDFTFGHLEIAIQLALYAHGRAIWNTRTQTYEPLPAIDQDTAVVMHCPVGTARCDLYAIDIAAGWQAAQLCKRVRGWRNRRDLATPWAGRNAGTDQAVLAEIDAATSVAELGEIWARADARGDWTAAHTRAAAARKRDLTTTRRTSRKSAAA